MMTGLTAADELEHPDVNVESWWWWAWSNIGADTVGVFVGLELRGQRFDYWAGLVRESQSYLLVAELDGSGRRSGLELKPPELWADHVCDAPFRQWSVVNEAYGVMLDPPADVWGHGFGRRVPVAMDIEWFATEAAVTAPHGYVQQGSADVVVELSGGALRFDGPAKRVHTWGVPFVPTDLAAPLSPLVGPYLRSDGRAVQQVLTRDGFLGRTVTR